VTRLVENLPVVMKTALVEQKNCDASECLDYDVFASRVVHRYCRSMQSLPLPKLSEQQTLDTHCESSF
jgi:hypothetical protein